MNDTNIPATHGIKPPLEMESGDSILWPIVLLVVLFLVGAALLFWAYHKPKPTHTPIEPETEAHRKLRQAWALLGTPALFAEAVADILRVYLGQRFAFHAPERTTDEFLQELQRLPQMTDPQKTLLGQFLVSCDLSKFA